MEEGDGLSAAIRQHKSGNHIAALQLLNQVLESPVALRNAETHVLLAEVLLALEMKSEAAAAYQKAARYDITREDDYHRRAMNLYLAAGDDDQALLAAKRFMPRVRQDPEVAFVLATVFIKRGQLQVVQGLRRVLIESEDPRHVLLSLHFLDHDADNEDNLLTARRVLELYPHRHDLRFYLQMMLREHCDFEAMRLNFVPVRAELNRGNSQILKAEQALSNIFWCGEERWNRLACASAPPPPLASAAAKRRKLHKWRYDILRIGYLSADFWPHHATMKLLRDVLEKHDRQRFEIYLFCSTPPSDIEASGFDRSRWGHVVTISHLSDQAAAEEIRAREIDVLIDLKGPNKNNRSAILNLGVAPVQVAWLGFPGPVLNVDLDYVIGDRVVLPDSSKPHYDEKFCRLPETYQPNDPVNRPRPGSIARERVGLPPNAFVFASFNGGRKITDSMIAVWARILVHARGSVLWLMAPGERMRNNLLQEFERNGITEERIVFAPTIRYDLHIARMATADLMLDAYPCNGHTTTSEALWGGLPVLTYQGTNFASRVSESLLRAIGLPELVADDEDAYVRAAVDLWARPDLVAELKARLNRNRFLMPLFDSERFCRHLETAYEMMAARARAGQPPAHFDVPALAPRSLPFGAL